MNNQTDVFYKPIMDVDTGEILDIPRRIRFLLYRKNWRAMTIEELTAMTTEELFKLRGMGRQTALEIITALDAAGIKHNFQVEAPKTEKQILNGLIRDIGVDKAIIVLEKYGKALEKNS